MKQFLKKTMCKWFFGPNAWAALTLPSTWRDKDEIIRRVLFEALVRFVEDEDDLQNGRTTEEYADEMRYLTETEIVERINKREALLQAYHYIKTERAEMEANPDWVICLAKVEKRDQETMELIVKHSGYLWT
jgi:hypothetical protein